MYSLRKLMACAVGVAFVMSVQAQPVPFWSNRVGSPPGPGGYTFVCDVNQQGDMFVAKGTPTSYLNVSKIDRNGVARTKQILVDPAAPATQANFLCPTPDGGVVVAVEGGTVSDGQVNGPSKLMKFDASLNLQWSVDTGGWTNSDWVDPSREGRLYATPDGSIFLAQFMDGADAVVKYSAAGTTLWTQRFDRTNLNDGFIFDLVTDGSGGVWGSAYAGGDGALIHFTGNSASAAPIQLPGSGWTYHIDRDSSGNLFFSFESKSGNGVAKADPAGNILWSGLTVSHGNDSFDMAVDPMGFSYLLTLNDSVTKSVVTRFDPNGNVVYSKSYGPDVVAAHVSLKLIVDPSGNAFLVNGNGYGLTKILPNGDLGWPNLADGTYIAPIDANYQPDPIRGARDVFGNFYLAGSEHDPVNKSAYYVGAAKLGLGNNSAFVAQNVPSQMVAGQHYWVSLSFQDVGLNTWTAADNYFLKSQNPVGNSVWGFNRVDFGAGDSVALNGIKNFGFYVTAPMTAGVHNFQWKIAQNVGSFGMASPNVPVNVIVRDHAAQYVSQSLPSTVSAGSSFTVKVTMKNVGTKTWTQAGGYALQPAPGYPGWGVSSVPLAGSDSIAPGASKTFTFMCKAPSTSGTYSMRWQMHRASPAFTGFFGDLTTNKSIVVTP